MIYLISGSGRGAGKTTLARKMVGQDLIFSHAAELRVQLEAEFPGLPWFAVDQASKDLPRHELNGKSIRDVMLTYGQEMCRKTTTDYWAKILGGSITRFLSLGDGHGDACPPPSVAVDDLRKVVELECLRRGLGHYGIIHFHVKYSEAIAEPEFDNEKLEELADYVVRWEK